MCEEMGSEQQNLVFHSTSIWMSHKLEKTSLDSGKKLPTFKKIECKKQMFAQLSCPKFWTLMKEKPVLCREAE
jgi:hypothetical protein